MARASPAVVQHQSRVSPCDRGTSLTTSHDSRWSSALQDLDLRRGFLDELRVQADRARLRMRERQRYRRGRRRRDILLPTLPPATATAAAGALFEQVIDHWRNTFWEGVVITLAEIELGPTAFACA